MLKKIFFIFILLLSFNLTAQRALFNQNFDEFSEFDIPENELKQYKSEGKLTIFNVEKHSTSLAKKLFDLKVGKTYEIKKGTFTKVLKVVASKEIEHYRINYIFLDGNKFTYDKIDKLRDKLKNMAGGRYDFKGLAKQYSMDMNRNRGGDSGWFKEGRIHEDFRNAALSKMRNANEIFKIDLENEKWFYLVKKTYSPRKIREIVVLETEVR
ncbi:peptidylprolyl isomerase [Psychroflexus aestuariivivens]|uniref:peptidylprolyl isomerase n=1 Tax=Psychroflexus aestuariivivens TaxID=1795040 RepID=UPI000FD74D2A|nr:peptidylprolyl isomerase [Psychroflexus aestuariivivens]